MSRPWNFRAFFQFSENKFPSTNRYVRQTYTSYIQPPPPKLLALEHDKYTKCSRGTPPPPPPPPYPPVRDDLDEIVGRQRVLDRHCKGNRVLLFCILLFHHEGLVMQDFLTVYVLHDNPKQHSVVVDLAVLGAGGRAGVFRCCMSCLLYHRPRFLGKTGLPSHHSDSRWIMTNRGGGAGGNIRVNYGKLLTCAIDSSRCMLPISNGEKKQKNTKVTSGRIFFSIQREVTQNTL